MPVVDCSAEYETESSGSQNKISGFGTEKQLYFGVSSGANHVYTLKHIKFYISEIQTFIFHTYTNYCTFCYIILIHFKYIITQP